MADLEGFADQGTPLLTDLRRGGPALGRLIKAQGTLADASRERLPEPRRRARARPPGADPARAR